MRKRNTTDFWNKAFLRSALVDNGHFAAVTARFRPTYRNVVRNEIGSGINLRLSSRVRNYYVFSMSASTNRTDRYSIHSIHVSHLFFHFAPLHHEIMVTI